MKDLIDFCQENKVGAIEGLKSYPRHAPAAKLQMQKMQEMQQLASVQCLPTDRNTLNKLMALHPGMNNNMSNSHHMVGRGALSGSAQAALALTNYQNLLMSRNSINSNPNSLQPEASSSFNNANQSPSSSFQSATGFMPGSMQNLAVSSFSSAHLPPQPHQLQQRSLSGNNLLQQSHPQSSQGNQALQHQMIQQLLQEMSNNNGSGVQQQSLSGQANGIMSRNGLGFGANSPAPTTSNMSGGGVPGPTTNRSNSFKAAAPANSESSAAASGGNNGFHESTRIATESQFAG